MNWRGTDAAHHLVEEGEAGAARQRLDGQMHIAELAMPAALALEAGMLGDALADGLLVLDLGPVRS